MSGKKPPPTALVRRASPNLSDDDLASMLHRRHLFDRGQLRGTLDPDAPTRIRLYEGVAFAAGASYLIYSETTQRFIGFRRRGVFILDGSETSRRMQLVFFPEASA